MTYFTCTTGMCPDPSRCLNAGACERADLPIVTVTEPRDASPEVMQKRVDEMGLADYRRGTDRAMAHLWKERPEC